MSGTQFIRCDADHMHHWHETEPGVIGCEACKIPNCPNRVPGKWHYAHDNPEPEPVDAEMAYIISNTEWTSVKGTEMLRELVALARNEMAAEIESSVLADLPRNPVGFSDLLRTTVQGYEDAIRLEDERWRNSPFYKIMQQRQAEIRLLYGTMTNYFLVMEYKPQQRA